VRVDDLMTKIPEWEREADEHERKARALRQIIEGVRTLNGDAERLFGGMAGGNTSGGMTVSRSAMIGLGPRGREAVRMIAVEQPGVWKVKDLKDEILRRGWPDPGTGTEAALKRLAAAGEAERIGHGTYKIGRVQHEPADAAPASEEVELPC
jgi:hypothetical protein